MLKPSKIPAAIPVLAIFLLSMALLKDADPIDTLIKQTKDSKLRAKMVTFKKGGYGKTASYKKHDVEAIIKSAKAFIGTPHCMGGLTKEGIDCSGLVMVVHQQNGIALPHDGNEQARFGTIKLSVNELKRGDLVFFHSTYNTSKLVSHSGIYLGNEEFIHVSSKKGVGVASIKSKYWSGYFLFGTRL